MKIRKIREEITTDAIGCENEGCEKWVKPVVGTNHLPRDSNWIMITIHVSNDLCGQQNFCTWQCLSLWSRDQAERIEDVIMT